MTRYATEDPVVERETDDAGTTVSDVRPLGAWTDYAARASDRIPAFLALAKLTGGVLATNDEGMTVERALERAGLDFLVELHPFASNLPIEGEPAAFDVVPGVEKMRSVIARHRGGRLQSLGVAGRRYKPVQPIQAGTFGQAVMEEGGANIVAAGAYGDPIGSRMYLAFKMPNALMIGGQDAHDLYLTVGNSWNRETGLWGCVAPIRIRCTNQAAGIFGRRSNRFILRHTGEMDVKVSEVQQALEITGTFSQEYAAAAERLLGADMLAGELDAFLEELLPTPPTVKTERGADGWENKRRQVRTIITNGERNDFGRGTRYAALQGAYEWADWFSKANSDLNRFTRMVDGGEIEEIKIRASRLLMANL